MKWACLVLIFIVFGDSSIATSFSVGAELNPNVVTTTSGITVNYLYGLGNDIFSNTLNGLLGSF